MPNETKLIVPLADVWWETDELGQEISNRILPIDFGEGLLLERFYFNSLPQQIRLEPLLNTLLSGMEKAELKDCRHSISKAFDGKVNDEAIVAEPDVGSLIASMRIVRPTRAYPLCRFVIDETGYKLTQKLSRKAYIRDADDTTKEEWKEEDIGILKRIYPQLKKCFENGRGRLFNASYMHEKAYTEQIAEFRLVYLAIALESLFNTDPAEVSYKIANRASWFLGKDTTERSNLFGQIKDAYDYRSRVVHGNTIKKSKHETLIVHTENLTRVVQQALLKILRDELYVNMFDGNDDKLRDFLDGLTLGVEG